MPMYNYGIINNVAYKISQVGLNLPSGVNLNGNDVEYICENIKKIKIIKCRG